jgi:hypothetical protein
MNAVDQALLDWLNWQIKTGKRTITVPVVLLNHTTPEGRGGARLLALQHGVELTGKHLNTNQKPRRGPMRVTGRRIPRPRDKQLLAMFFGPDWVDTRDKETPEWVPRLRARAARIGVRVIYDTQRNWRETFFCSAAGDGKPYILCGGAGEETFCCTALIHELAHAMLHKRHNHPSDEIPGEEATWQLANRIAQEERLPLMAQARRKGIHSYRRAALLASVARSKNRAKPLPIPKTGTLTGSRRSAAANVPPDRFPMGKKGRRKTKRDVKRSTVKAERRAPHSDLE